MLASSGTAGLVGALFATAGRAGVDRPLCICPAFTFVATAIAAVSAGYQPFLADIDPETWALDPVALRRLPALSHAGAVVPVAPMGRTPDLDAWQAFQEETGIPVVMDAAACFDTLDLDQLKRCSFPVVISLHATKTLSTAEGGLVLCGSPEVAARVTRALNFGFYESRESIGPSINGKLSEYHAAVGLADLDGWDEKRAGFLRLPSAIRRRPNGMAWASESSSRRNMRIPTRISWQMMRRGRNRAGVALAGMNFDTRRWYSNGLQAQPFLAAGEGVPGAGDGGSCGAARRPACACDLEQGKIDRIVQIISCA